MTGYWGAIGILLLGVLSTVLWVASRRSEAVWRRNVTAFGSVVSPAFSRGSAGAMILISGGLILEATGGLIFLEAEPQIWGRVHRSPLPVLGPDRVRHDDAASPRRRSVFRRGLVRSATMVLPLARPRPDFALAGSAGAPQWIGSLRDGLEDPASRLRSCGIHGPARLAPQLRRDESGRARHGCVRCRHGGRAPRAASGRAAVVDWSSGGVDTVAATRWRPESLRGAGPTGCRQGRWAGARRPPQGHPVCAVRLRPRGGWTRHLEPARSQPLGRAGPDLLRRSAPSTSSASLPCAPLGSRGQRPRASGTAARFRPTAFVGWASVASVVARRRSGQPPSRRHLAATD